LIIWKPHCYGGAFSFCEIKGRGQKAEGRENSQYKRQTANGRNETAKYSYKLQAASNTRLKAERLKQKGKP
jgi:hypothetical protein